MKRLLLAWAVVCRLSLPAVCGSFEIAREGRPASAIVVADDGAATASAAKELAAYFKRLSGAEVPVVRQQPATGRRIVVGRLDGGADEEIVLSVTGDALRVGGGCDRAVMYAAYELLERLGCGFWGPDNETVPNRPTLAYEQEGEVRESPAFAFRQPYGHGMAGVPAWTVKCKANGQMWAKAIPPELGGGVQMDMRQTMMDVEGTTNGTRAAVVERRRLFLAHPEWFAWRKDKGARVPHQLCTSNPEAMAEVVRRARDLMRREPDRRCLCVSFADNDRVCECEKCLAFRAAHGNRVTASLIDAVNRVAREMKDEWPKLTITFLAYWVTEEPPPDAMKLEPNVGVVYAVLDRNYAKPPSGTPRHDKYLAKWLELSNGNVWIWGYNANFKAYLYPTPILDLLGPEVREYRKAKIRGVFMQLPFGSVSDFADLRCWLLAKLLWNPQQDEWALVDRWCDGACGAGAGEIRRLLRFYRDVRNAHRHLGVYMPDSRPVFTADQLFEADDLLARAEAKTAGDARTNLQVRKLRMSTRVAMATRYRLDLAETARKRGVALPPYEEILDGLDRDTRALKNGSFSEPYDWHAFMTRMRSGGFIQSLRAK